MFVNSLDTTLEQNDIEWLWQQDNKVVSLC